jgi:hypothetical protein
MVSTPAGLRIARLITVRTFGNRAWSSGDGKDRSTLVIVV